MEESRESYPINQVPAGKKRMLVMRNRIAMARKKKN